MRGELIALQVWVVLNISVAVLAWLHARRRTRAAPLAGVVSLSVERARRAGPRVVDSPGSAAQTPF